MRFATLERGGTQEVFMKADAGGWVPVAAAASDVPTDLLSLIDSDRWWEERSKSPWRGANGPSVDHGFPPNARICAPYTRPRKIWGIGLNYRDHARDLNEAVPEAPASFMKGDHTIIGHGDFIRLPSESARVTSEAELGLIIGRECRNVTRDEASAYLFGVTPVLDQTAEDILRLNPRYLTRSKNFETFFSFGPEVVTIDEFLSTDDDLKEVTVATCLNGKVVRENSLSNMTHGLWDLVSFHSQMMPLYPGDIISTGTPGAAVVTHGDVVEARITGLAPLRNRVSQDRL